MTGYIVRRLLQTAPMILVVGTLGFLLIHIAPGDPVIALSGEFAHEEVQRELRERYALDRGLLDQYFAYLSRLSRGELGVSYYFQRPVAAVIWDRFPATLMLVLPSLILSTLAGLGLGFALSKRLGHRWARGLVALIAASNAVPVFWLAQILLLVFAVTLDWLPVQGMADPRTGSHWLDVGWHLVLPLATLTLHQFALIAVLTWTGIEQELERDYVRAAASRGLTDNKVLLHAFRNTLPPVVTAVGGRVGALFSGAVLTEIVFAWPGLGRLAVLASLNRDYPLVLGLFLFITMVVVLSNLLTDVFYAVVDPRIRYR